MGLAGSSRVWLRVCPLLAPFLLAAATAAAQVVDYSRAEQLLTWNTERLVVGDAVEPTWYPNDDRFWYRNNTGDGHEFVLIDPVRNTRGHVFDRTRLAAAMSLANDTSYAPNRLPFQKFKFGNDGDDTGVIEFNASKKRFVCDIAGYRCVVGDTLPSEDPFVKSPDKRWEAFIHDHNLHIRPVGGGDTIPLTSDGVEYWSYGLTAARPNERVRGGPRRPNLRWSPDSRRIVVDRRDERGVEHMHYIASTHQRPKHFSQPYALPGDSVVPTPGLHIVDIVSRTNVPVAMAPRANQLFYGSARDSVWSEGSDRVKVAWLTRASRAAYLGEVDASTGALRILAGDSAKTYVELSQRDPASWYVTRSGDDAIWWSERDGWAHLYRFDRDGNLRNQITSGPWTVGAVQHVDERRRQIYFTGRGREPGRNLYYAHLYRVNFDGSGLTLLTPEDANHEISFSPSGRYFVDSYSRIEQEPISVLRSVPDGRVIRTLEKADVSALRAVGWRPAEVFEVKARDGITNLYGVIYFPPNLDPTRKYPVINHIYPGPQVGSVGSWSFKGGGEPMALAQLGFVVVQLDHMGTPHRSKAFHDNYYGRFGDNGLPDHVTALKQLGARYPFLDMDRIGIYGHSGGGFASTGAMFLYPDFFKVAVSGAGNHDNRSYNIYWAEKYQGLMERDTLRQTDNFAEHANLSHAKNLKGKLLLIHGDMDDNVHPAMTIQVADALIKANKHFDMLIAPNAAHGLNEPYWIRRRWDYFVEHLMGARPPENYLIVKPEGSG
jgi:dipeptidyl-peptidase 4